ncbi:MAG: hypothetical protein M0P71_07390 [Melioribacteraceae bacterium]|jgi:hypothetical protein|nr:hypothetical protein [Melioribacteraceae bacterium]MDD3982822.1 hypothetical protein [Candidatus Omnitrophota bacterium]
MEKIKGVCGDCDLYDNSYCSYIGKNTSINDYCSFFSSVSIIKKPKEGQYFYYIQAEGLPRCIQKTNTNSALVEYYNYDFSEKAALIRAQEQFINNKLYKIAETFNDGWIPNWKDDEDKWYFGYHYDNFEDELCQSINKTFKNEYENTVYFKSKEAALQAWEMIKSDVEKLYELKRFYSVEVDNGI